MSDLLNSASLVMVPSGYKEDTVFSVVPSDGSGDLSFTRASNGTRVNSAGLVEVCPWNDLTYSQEIQNTSVWNVIGGDLVVTGNAVISPDGTQNAGAITLANSANRYFVHTILGLTGGVPYTYSVYMKSASGNLSVNMGGVNGLAGVLKTVTTEWQRFTYTFTPASSYSEYFGFDNRGAGSSTSGTLYFWGAQVNIGSTAKPYFPTTDRLNVPRLTYQNGGGGCPSLLLEKQSTNLCVQSNAFNTTPWAITSNLGTNPVITTNYGISPDGTQNASRVQLARTNANASYSQIFQYPVSVTSGQPYTWSVWLKSLSGTPTISIVGDFGRPPVTLTSEWVRYYGTGTAPTSIAQLEIAILGSTFSSGNSLTADFLIWGYQFEQSSYPTSYIPTTSSSATRVADACYKTGISSLIGQTEGTLFLDFEKTNNDNVGLGGYFRIDLNDGTIDNRILFGFDLNNINATVVSGGSVVANISTSGVQTQTRIKAAFSYKANDFILYVNGVQIGVDLSGSVPSGMANFNWGINQTTVTQTSAIINAQSFFKTRLTNAQLASLTTI